MSDYDDLRATTAWYLNADIGSRYMAGIPAVKVEPMDFTIDGYLTMPPVSITTPREARATLLARFESLLAALRKERFVLTGSPDLRFTSHLNPPMWTLGGEVHINEHEECIAAYVSISVTRCVKRRLPHGHDDQEATA